MSVHRATEIKLHVVLYLYMFVLSASYIVLLSVVHLLQVVLELLPIPGTDESQECADVRGQNASSG